MVIGTLFGNVLRESRTRRERALAGTYGPEVWSRVDQYREVQEYLADHPERGSTAVATALELSRNRIREWVDGDGRPDAVRAIRKAKALEWFDATPGDPRFEALAVCHAWIYAGGGIAEKNYRPTFTIQESDPEWLLTEALDTLGVEYHRYREGVDSRGTEIVPADHGALLGRFLVGVLDAPLGAKNEYRPTGVPTWLQRAPRETKRRWARIYVTVRGVDRNGDVQLTEQRDTNYRQSLVEFLRSVVDLPDTVRHYEDTSIYIERPTATELRTPPDPLAG
jgi:hypothetical protein